MKMYAVITHRTCRRGCCPGRRPWCGSGSSSCWSSSRVGPAAGQGRCSGDPFHGAPGLRMKYSVNEGAVQMEYSKDYTNRRWQYLINTLPTASVLRLFFPMWLANGKLRSQLMLGQQMLQTDPVEELFASFHCNTVRQKHGRKSQQTILRINGQRRVSYTFCIVPRTFLV